MADDAVGRATGLKSDSLFIRDIFRSRERPAERMGERVQRVFVLISSKQEMRLSIGERLVPLLPCSLAISGSFRRGWLKSPELRISIHLTAE